jgi:hypothetical protein
MPNKIIQYLFLSIFALTAIVTILGIAAHDYVRIDEFYLKRLFAALLLELIAVVIAAAKLAFGVGGVEHYIWQIVYPTDLRQTFETLYLKDPTFAAFYAKKQKHGTVHNTGQYYY